MPKNNGLQMKYFVLKPGGNTVYSQASRSAMVHYAEIIQKENPELADDLIAWAGREAGIASRTAKGGWG